MYALVNEPLQIFMDYEGGYKGTRFDRLGRIISFGRDGIDFMGAEYGGAGLARNAPAKGIQGIGLCNEFGLKDPIGYDDPDSDVFLKIGVGWLKKDGKPYRESHQYEADRLVGERDGRAFVFDSGVENGYGVRLVKEYSLLGPVCDGLEVKFSLMNIGEKRIKTSEYCHNFMSVAGFWIDSRYRIKTGNPEIDKKVKELIAGALPMYYAAYDDPEEVSGWELTHEISPFSFKEKCHFPVSRFAVWGTRAVISAECFYAIDLAPGESASWGREYFIG
ncbi:MAG: hypothetical protein LBT59_04885 [Clostridiales bacterium]|jgi:hypothetical protein|nr:hypothetical protein [Clostridiales bacterium]